MLDRMSKLFCPRLSKTFINYKNIFICKTSREARLVMFVLVEKCVFISYLILGLFISYLIFSRPSEVENGGQAVMLARRFFCASQ